MNIIYCLSGGFLMITCNVLSFCNVVNFNNILITRIFQFISQRNVTLGKTSEIRMIPKPNLFFDCRIIFKVPAVGISSHEQMNFDAILLSFCFAEVIGRSTTGRYQLISESTYRWYSKILFFG